MMNKTQPMLSKLAKCQCGSLMTVATGDGERPPRYTCLDPACQSREIPVRELDELIINRLIADVFTSDMLAEVDPMLRETAAQQATIEERRLEALHGELERLDIETTGADAQDLTKLDEERRTVRDEARKAEHELEGLRHIASDDEIPIEAYARNPETYLRATNAATTKSILETVMQEVLVSDDSVAVTYTAAPHI